MNIAGMGLVFSRGRGVAALEQALQQGWVAPTEIEVRGLTSRLPVYSVSAELLLDKTVLAKARRADRFVRMAVLAASDAVQDSGLADTLVRQRLGVIVATALGPHVTTFSFIDGILDFGEKAVSPTAFSHSVHNAAASYIATTLDIRGPTLTLTHFHFAFQQAVQLAQAWLQEKRCDAVLVGTVDELGEVMEFACGQMATPARDGRLKPFAFSATPEIVPGEGSAFFLLTPEPAGAAYAELEVLGGRPVAPPPGGGIQLLDTFGTSRDERGYRAVISDGIPIGGYAPLFGSILTGSAFHVATGALMLKRQVRYACPVQDNPQGVMLCTETAPARLSHVVSTRMDCAARAQTVGLTHDFKKR